MLNSWDLETFPFGPGKLAPKVVCLSLCDEEDNSLLVASCEPDFDDVLEHCLKNPMANSNIAYDMAVVMANRPKMIDLVFDAYERQQVYDILIREKLITLGCTGDLEFIELPNGSTIPLKWTQADLEKRHLGIDRSADKTDEDGWRKHFDVLDGVPASEYPTDARDYALADAVNGMQLYKHQERRIKEQSLTVLGAQHLNTRASLALYLSSCWGFPIVREEVEQRLAELHKVWDDDAIKVVDGKTVLSYQHMLDDGILIPKKPAAPYGNQMRRAEEALGFKPVDWEEHRERLEALGIRFTKPKPPSYSTVALKAKVVKLCEQLEIPVPMTDEDKNVRFDKKAQADLAGFDPALDEYIERKEIERLVTTALPRIVGYDRIHPKYDILKKTSRTSSYGNRKEDKNPAYPADNIQQVDPRVRDLYTASPGRILCSADYSAIELASAAQTCFTLFGESVLADKINAGFDPHAYLGAAIARMFSNGEFVGSPDPDENYRLFVQLKTTNRPFYDHYRKMAKPTGLGYPGGLGSKTFVGFAKAIYGVDLVKLAGSFEGAVEMGEQLKRVWLDTYPEFGPYFTWVKKNCVDVEFSVPGDKRYAYISPYGTVRRNCTYTECTNGASMQTRTAEGAKAALWEAARRIYDKRLNDPLFGSPVCAFIHDELIADMIYDDFTHERAFSLAEAMVEGMKTVITDVQVKAEPCLMFRWNKAAEPCFDSNNRLIPWQPSAA